MMKLRASGLTPLFFVLPMFLGACSSTELKQRQEVRERVVKSSIIYCEFINGDAHPDIDVAVNIAMGAKCDTNKSMSLTHYRTTSEVNGVLFCCGVREPKSETLPELPSKRDSLRVTPKVDEPKTEDPAPQAETPKPQTRVRVTPNRPAAAAAKAAAKVAPAPPSAPASAPAPAPAKAVEAKAESSPKTEERKPNNSGIQFEAEPEAGE